ncbi:MAG: YegS/Rv2252/BmrU family lipid kinase [Solobacterium sp.]|nr:YegS/Rv2252/BmrU family lipid kinase [Solobacterium sp.]
MKFEIIVNPAGAGGKTAKFWKQWEPCFSGAEYEVHFSSKEHGIREITQELTSQGRDVNLVIVGGDGSMNEAVNGIADFSHVRLGLLPCGSANDLAADIGMHESMEQQIKTILQGKTVRSIDVGEVVLHNQSCRIDPITKAADPTEIREEKRMRFNVSAGIGWDAEICRTVDISPMKQPLNRIHLGKLIYIAEAIRTVFAMNTFRCDIEAEGKTLSFDRCVFCALMNHRFEGGGFMFGPHAKNDDGILDLCAVNDVTPLKFFAMFPKAYKGRQFETRHAFEKRCAEFHFHTDRPVWVHTDGEVSCMSSDVTIHLLKERLNLLF